MPRDLLLPNPTRLRLGEGLLPSDRASFIGRSPLRFHWLNLVYIRAHIYHKKLREEILSPNKHNMTRDLGQRQGIRFGGHAHYVIVPEKDWELTSTRLRAIP